MNGIGGRRLRVKFCPEPCQLWGVSLEGGRSAGLWLAKPARASGSMGFGGVAEWSMATVLKTVVLQGTVGSNPTASA